MRAARKFNSFYFSGLATSLILKLSTGLRKKFKVRELLPAQYPAERYYKKSRKEDEHRECGLAFVVCLGGHAPLIVFVEVARVAGDRSSKHRQTNNFGITKT